MYKCDNNAISAKGSKPTAQVGPADKGRSGHDQQRTGKATNAASGSTFADQDHEREGSRTRTRAKEGKDADEGMTERLPTASRSPNEDERGRGRGGCGGEDERATGGRGNARGGVAHTQTAVWRPCVGAKVENVSGRGKCRVGVVVGVIPVGWSPRHWCLSHGFPPLFRPDTSPTIRERVIVESDGEVFTPETVREVR